MDAMATVRRRGKRRCDFRRRHGRIEAISSRLRFRFFQGNGIHCPIFGHREMISFRCFRPILISPCPTAAVKHRGRKLYHHERRIHGNTAHQRRGCPAAHRKPTHASCGNQTAAAAKSQALRRSSDSGGLPYHLKERWFSYVRKHGLYPCKNPTENGSDWKRILHKAFCFAMNTVEKEYLLKIRSAANA